MSGCSSRPLSSLGQGCSCTWTKLSRQCQGLPQQDCHMFYAWCCWFTNTAWTRNALPKTQVQQILPQTLQAERQVLSKVSFRVPTTDWIVKVFWKKETWFSQSPSVLFHHLSRREYLGISEPWCPSCNHTNSVKVLKRIRSTHRNQGKITHWPHVFFISRKGHCSHTLTVNVSTLQQPVAKLLQQRTDWLDIVVVGAQTLWPVGRSQSHCVVIRHCTVLQLATTSLLLYITYTNLHIKQALLKF